MLHQTYNSPLVARLPSLRPAQPNEAAPKPTRHEIDPIAFIAALVLAPVLPALVTSPLLLMQSGLAIIAAIPLAAIIFGGIPYLVLGIPALLYVLSRKGPNTDAIIGAALCITLGLCAVVGLTSAVMSPASGAGVLFLGGFSLFFAALWSGLFAWLYRKFARVAGHDPIADV